MTTSRNFDGAEHALLVRYFRDEAADALQYIANRLLSTKQCPTPDAINAILQRTHGLKGAAGTVDLPEIAFLIHRYEGIFSRLRTGDLPWTAPMRDCLLQIADELRALIANMNEPEVCAQQVRAIAHAIGAIEQSHGVDMNPPSTTRHEQVVAATKTTTLPREHTEAIQFAPKPAFLRIPPERIDRLMSDATELGFDRLRIEKRIHELEQEVSKLLGIEKREDPRVAMTAKSRTQAELIASANSLMTCVRGFQQDLASLTKTQNTLQQDIALVRMQSVNALFQELAPQLRAIAREGQRRVRLVTAGADTEFDKSVADQLIGPTIQLLRNCVAHGIEPPPIRKQRGKNEEGRITITARHEAHAMVLEVSDDGGGIDVGALRARLQQKGGATTPRELSDEQIIDTIFEPGMSSRSTVDTLAGRGIGLSAVRETIARLGGELRVHTIFTKGTTFTIRVPLAAAVVHALLLEVEEQILAIPMVHIDSALMPRSVRSNDESIPTTLSLRRILGLPPSPAAETASVGLRYLSRGCTLLCDRIAGEERLVVTPLGPLLSLLPLYAGGAIGIGGKIYFILDPAAIVACLDDAESCNVLEQNGHRQKILVVDDSKTTRLAIRATLTSYGYHVETAPDGASALRALQTEQYDALVTDIDMPGENGFALINRLRLDETLHSLPVIVISSRIGKKDRALAMTLGVRALLEKPVSRTSLVQALTRTFQESE